MAFDFATPEAPIVDVAMPRADRSVFAGYRPQEEEPGVVAKTAESGHHATGSRPSPSRQGQSAPHGEVREVQGEEGPWRAHKQMPSPAENPWSP